MSITSERLSDLMSSQRISTKELAFKVGVSIYAVECYLNGNVQPEEKVIHKLAVALNTNPDYLLGVPFHKVIWDRISSPDAENYPDPWWNAEIKQFTFDVNASIRFIREECSDEELWWLGEIFDDLMEVTRSVELLNSIRERVKLVSNAEWKKDLLEDIRTAAEYVE